MFNVHFSHQSHIKSPSPIQSFYKENNLLCPGIYPPNTINNTCDLSSIQVLDKVPVIGHPYDLPYPYLNVVTKMVMAKSLVDMMNIFPSDVKTMSVSRETSQDFHFHAGYNFSDRKYTSYLSRNTYSNSSPKQFGSGDHIHTMEKEVPSECPLNRHVHTVTMNSPTNHVSKKKGTNNERLQRKQEQCAETPKDLSYVLYDRQKCIKKWTSSRNQKKRRREKNKQLNNDIQNTWGSPSNSKCSAKVTVKCSDTSTHSTCSTKYSKDCESSQLVSKSRIQTGPNKKQLSLTIQVQLPSKPETKTDSRAAHFFLHGSDSDSDIDEDYDEDDWSSDEYDSNIPSPIDQELLDSLTPYIHKSNNSSSSGQTVDLTSTTTSSNSIEDQTDADAEISSNNIDMAAINATWDKYYPTAAVEGLDTDSGVYDSQVSYN